MIEPIHQFFGLTYSSYLVLHRVALQSMPVDWQEKFVKLLDELRDTIDYSEFPDQFAVQVRDRQGRFIQDKFADYQRGRARAPLRASASHLPANDPMP